jgi:hypothetical protein
MSWVVLGAAVPLACSGDPGRRTALGEGGEGGGAGSPTASGGSSILPGGGKGGSGGMPSSGGANDPVGGGDAGATTLPGGGTGNDRGGAPPEVMAGAAGAGGAGIVTAPVLPGCEGTLTFPDSYVEQQILMALGKDNGPVTQEDVAGLTELEIPFNDANITITGLECLTNVQILHFSDGAVGYPLEVLNKMPNLVSVDYSNGYLSDETLVQFKVLTGIVSLDLGRNFISDLTPLASLTQLRHLALSFIGNFNQTPVDITPLASLVNLRTLDLSHDELIDGAPLAALTKLQQLSLESSKLPSLDVVSGLTNLTTLDIGQTGLTALPDLSKLTKLTALSIAYDELASFAAVSALTRLTALNVSSTKLTDLSVLSPLTQLQTLDVTYNDYGDATVLGALPNLTTLDTSFCTITSLQPMVDSAYIGPGDSVTADLADCDTHKAALQALVDKGVNVSSFCLQ